jgi:hypothetical protein
MGESRRPEVFKTLRRWSRRCGTSMIGSNTQGLNLNFLYVDAG